MTLDLDRGVVRAGSPFDRDVIEATILAAQDRGGRPVILACERSCRPGSHGFPAAHGGARGDSPLEAIPIETLQGIRDLALMSVFFLTGCRVSAVTAACVGHLETDGVEHYLNVTENWCDRHGRPGQAAETPARFNSAGTQELCQNSGTVGRSVARCWIPVPR